MLLSFESPLLFFSFFCLLFGYLLSEGCGRNKKKKRASKKRGEGEKGLLARASHVKRVLLFLLKGMFDYFYIAFLFYFILIT